MATTTNPVTVNDMLADARNAWNEFATAASSGKSSVAAFTAYRVALAVADAADAHAKRTAYQAALARYKSIADKVNYLNNRISSATMNDGALTAVAQGRIRTTAEKAEMLRESNVELNALAVECKATEYTVRTDDDTTRVHLLRFADMPRAPMPSRASDGFEKDYMRAFDSVLGEHFATAEQHAITAWRQRQ